MNRIRELREAAGMTQADLAAAAGTSAPQISRLEDGERKLTAEWMGRLATALGCAPSDLIQNVVFAELSPDVEDAVVTELGRALSAAARHGLKFYKIIGHSVSDTGLKVGEHIAVDLGEDALASADNGDVLLVNIGGVLVLRQFLSPGLLVTNRPGANIVIRADDKTIAPKVIGIVMRD